MEANILQQSTYKNPLGYLPIPTLLRQFALPAVISMVVNAIYNIVDQLFIGRGVGYLGNAATTVTFPIVMIALGFATMLGAGGSAFASIRLGEGKDKLAERALGNVLMMALVLAGLIMLIGLPFLDQILNLFGATPGNIGYSRDYAFWILLGMPFNITSVCLSNMARTDGKPMVAMCSLLVGAALNVVLDAIFLFIFDWGVMGAALATSISQMVSSVVLMIYFLKFGRMRFNRNSMKPDLWVCGQTMILGFSSCVVQLAGSAVQIVLNRSLGHWGNLSAVTGDVALSAMGIVLKINQIFISVCVGISIGNQPILGFNRGARQPARIKQAYQLAATVATVVSTVGWLVFMLIPRQVISLFGTESQQFVDFAVHSMRGYLGALLLVGFQIVTTGYFQATGQPLKAATLSALRQIVLLIPLILLLPQIMGVYGIAYAGMIADIITAVVVILVMRKEMKRLNGWIANPDTMPMELTAKE